MTQQELDSKLISISRAIAVLLLLSYALFVWFQTRTHHGLFTKMFEKDEERDHDRAKDARKPKLTLTECILALAVSVALVAIIAVNLVHEIDPIIEEHHITDPFMGLILVPLVEKLAEHLTAIDEAWDNQMNFALTHCVGATLQTALLVTPLIVIISWCAQWDFSLDFQIFDMAMLLLSIITVGNFLRDQKSNYLEGFLCVAVYVAIAVAAFYNPGAHAAEAAASTSETAEHLIAKVVGSL
ncbi:Sodium/calcium exchanger protein-domain-containing protein [Truncatella angustata]|uniref:Sodium/calcium exchanger protein-domain-containing protein n=1 Tax=Truncatella angustata TaxID=152316 RepID=A0A9P8UTL3_9PEZI|nr:Sodium/calcium exchanger protein-domain-containing protein [Truncatella angustata]KAH6658914.1 Sodium/calcium exchanger protein-domain-containing protein [Truncatella angustata]